ncbi:MAG: alpha/beta fold hydrolase [Myxococcota bacterium]
MTPGFFGPEGEQLLGIHHPPRGAARGVGVLLCPSAPPDRSRSHWALRKLAEQLARGGFDVLRFDLRGTGDSNGELDDTTPEQWIEDVHRAAKELKALSGVRRISAVGFRLGAILAARAATGGLALDTLVLWEPVVDGGTWIERLQQQEAEQHRREHHFHTPLDPLEVYGFELPSRLFAQWRALELAPFLPAKGRTEVVVAEDELPDFRRLRRAWEGRSVNWHRVGGVQPDAVEGALLGNEALDAIARLLGEKR